MKRFCLALITILCVSIPAVAQERWMVNQTATLGLDKLRAPRYSLGIETSCYLLQLGTFRVGPGAGVLFSLPYTDVYEKGGGPYPYYERAFTMPLFLRVEYGFGSENARFFTLLDVGTHITLAEGVDQYSDNRYRSLVFRPTAGTLQALFFTPQIGVNFGKHYYAAAGVWCQWARSQWAALALTASASLRIGVRF